MFYFENSKLQNLSWKGKWENMLLFVLLLRKLENFAKENMYNFLIYCIKAFYKGERLAQAISWKEKFLQRKVKIIYGFKFVVRKIYVRIILNLWLEDVISSTRIPFLFILSARWVRIISEDVSQTFPWKIFHKNI